MSFLDHLLLLKRELVERLAQMSAQFQAQRLASTFRNKDNVIFAVSDRVA